MDYKQFLVDYVNERTEIIGTKIQQETKQLRSLCAFFQSTKKEIEHFTAALQRVAATFKSSLYPGNGWTISICSLLSYEGEIINALNNYAASIGTSIAQPLSDFAEKYEAYKDRKSVV